MTKKKTIVLVSLIIILCASLALGNVSLDDTHGNANNNETKSMTAKQFLDVKETDWFYPDVNYAVEQNLMNGTDSTSFSPHNDTTRGMIVTILWRLDGSPLAGKKTFTDVKETSYYYDAVRWAFANNLIQGYDESHFGPEDFLTREQITTIMYRYAVHKEYDVSETKALDKYKDSAKISSYAVSAFSWALAKNIITGTSEDTLSPQDVAQRCQIAAILRRFCSEYISSDKESYDISENGDIKSATQNTGKSSSKNSGSSHTNKTPSSESNNTSEQVKYPLIKMSNITAKPGDTVQLFISIENNPGILGMILTAQYDENQLILESVENGEAFNDVLNLTTSKSLSSGARFVWDGLQLLPDDIKDGNILKMNFRISDTAKPGKHQIILTHAEGDIVDNTLSSISLPIEKGYITVE